MKHRILTLAPKLVAAAILAMGALPKFTGGAGALVERLPGGGLGVTAIGIAEVIAIVLILMPRTSRIGAGLVAAIMLGAIGSHLFGPIGLDGDFGAMFGMAVVAFLASLASLALPRLQRLPAAGAIAHQPQ